MPTASHELLLKAASDGNHQQVIDALQSGANVNARAEFGDTALNLAAERGHKDIVEELLRCAADIENRGGADKTPLMNAAFAGNIAIVRILLAHGAQVSSDLLQSLQLKVNILEENAEAGMVRPEALQTWRQFLQFLVDARDKQTQKPG